MQPSRSSEQQSETSLIISKESVSSEEIDTYKAKFKKFSKEKTKLLKEFFKQNTYPSNEDCKEISKEIDENVSKVRNWFKYYRKKTNCIIPAFKKRTLTKEEIVELNKHFEINQFPSIYKLKELSKIFGLKAKKLADWFSYQRRKNKLAKKQNKASPTEDTVEHFTPKSEPLPENSALFEMANNQNQSTFGKSLIDMEKQKQMCMQNNSVTNYSYNLQTQMLNDSRNLLFNPMMSRNNQQNLGSYQYQQSVNVSQQRFVNAFNQHQNQLIMNGINNSNSNMFNQQNNWNMTQINNFNNVYNYYNQMNSRPSTIQIEIVNGPAVPNVKKEYQGSGNEHIWYMQKRI